MRKIAYAFTFVFCAALSLYIYLSPKNKIIDTSDNVNIEKEFSSYKLYSKKIATLRNDIKSKIKDKK